MARRKSRCTPGSRSRWLARPLSPSALTCTSCRAAVHRRSAASYRHDRRREDSTSAVTGRGRCTLGSVPTVSSSEAARDWPASLVLVRHGESIGNLEARRAAEAGRARLQLDYRDPDTPLSDAGRRQAEALGRWWAEQPEAERPQVVLTSPYRRAADTARTAVETAGLDLDVRPDERLRERDLGAFDGLTTSGHQGAVRGRGRAARSHRQALLPAAGRRELVRRRAARAQPAAHLARGVRRTPASRCSPTRP